jgi:hypothetical protein
MGRPTGGRVAAGICEHQGEHQLAQGPHQERIAVTRVDAKGPGAGDTPLLSCGAGSVCHDAGIFRLPSGKVLNGALR